MKKLLLMATVALVSVTPFVAHAGDYEKGDKYKPKAEKVDMQSIVEIALADEQFSTLVAALKAADLVEALQGEGPFTVFAPTNDAFANLPEGALDDLLKPENKEKLQQVLKYHVVAAKVKSKHAVGKTTELDTLAGQSVTVDGTDGVTVDGANVIAADVKASNGIIHVIDTVIMPE